MTSTQHQTEETNVDLPEYIIIRVKRPEGYEDVHADLVAQDFLATHDSNNWQFDVVDAIPGGWRTEDGRAISAEQKAGMMRDGGAGASSVRPYAIPLYQVDQ